MVFNSKDAFFLDLGSEGAKPATVAMKSAPVAGNPSAGKPEANQKAQGGMAVAASVDAPTTGINDAPSGVLTTAEAIAAELRAAQAAMPAPSNATFAPDCLNPANAVPTARRRAGANLSGFKAIAKGLFRS